MSDKICLIHHFAGIGDIFFLQFVARRYLSMGYKIIWPLRPDILWIKEYISDIDFCSVNDDFPGKQYYGQDLVIISPQFVYLGIMRPHLWNVGYNKIMSSKYQIMNLNWEDWSSGFVFNRNRKKEENLYSNVLKLNKDSEYVLINNFYNTDNRDSKLLSKDQFTLPVVELKILDGFTLFDWCKVIEKAKKIYTINTSINYLIEVLNTNFDEYVIYAHNQDNQKEIDYLFKKPHKMLCK